MQSTKLPLIEYVEEALSHFNSHLFNDKLPMPIVSIQTDKKFTFRFVPDSYHLLIGQKSTKLKQKVDFCEELVHEMVHISNHLQKKFDCTSNSYHNRLFLNSALETGFLVAKHDIQGWALTKSDVPYGWRNKTIVFPKVSQNDLLKDAVEEFSLDVKDLIKSTNFFNVLVKPKTCFLKYECGCKPPHNSIRSGRRPDGNNPLRIRCEDCGKNFSCVEQ